MRFFFLCLQLTKPKQLKMETLTRSQLASIIQAIPTINIEFDEWDYNEKGDTVGEYKNDDYTVECDNEIYIDCSINVNESFSISRATQTNPSEGSSTGSNCEVELKVIWIDDIEYKATPEQENKIILEILKSINF